MRRALLASASGLAMLAGGTATAGTAFRSLPQAVTAHGSGAAAAIAPRNGVQAAQQAAIGLQNLQTATARFQSLQQALSTIASTAGQAGSSIPNGLAAGGLLPTKGYNAAGGKVWQGVSAAQPVVQSVSGGTTTVTINQTSPQAILNWQNFNVGRTTAVHFNQSAGGAAASTWSVLNRVTDPLAQPSEILGSITAPGQVLVLNLNGVLFAPGAQVSLHSLIAGAVSITDSQYLTNGIYSPNASTPSFLAAQGVVQVSQGAQIITNTASSVTSGGGDVILLGAGALNSGTIDTPGGQTILAAGQSFILQQGYGVIQSTTGSISGNTQSTVLGTEIQTSGAGIAANRGIIAATTGDITMAGENVEQAGVLLSSTSVARRGTIHLLTDLTTTETAADDTTTTVTNTGGTVTLAPGSVTEILPDGSDTTALNSAQQAGYITQQAYGSSTPLANEANLPDQPGLSRIEITSGGLVNFARDSLTLAPAGQIAVNSNGRIFAGSTAQLDVSGLTGVSLPMAANQLAVSVEPFNLRDSPVNNSVAGALNSNTIYLDIRQLTGMAASLADPEARDYTAGGLLEVSGELGNIGHTESEWSTLGGTIDLYANEVVAQPGSVFNIAGGSVAYQSGSLRQTFLVGPDGTLYNANTAPANLTYSGIFGGVQIAQPRWHITNTYESPFLSQAIAQPGYTAGRDAGSLVLSTPTAVFGGTIEGGVTAGFFQTQAPPTSTTDPFLLSQASAPIAGKLSLGNFSVYGQTGSQFYPTQVVIDQLGGALSALLPASARLSANLVDTASFAASQIDGLGGLSISVGDLAGTATRTPSITVRSALDMTPGAQIMLQAPLITIKASIAAPAGSISLETQNTALAPTSASVTVAEGVSLSTTGQFTNAVVDPSTISGAAFANGGKIAIESTGTLDLAPLSTLDTSAGASITDSGFSGGAGGSVSIVADDPSVAAPSVLEPVTVDAAITSYGVTTSGTLSLVAPQIFIAPYGVSHARDAITLKPGFFSAGFDAYVVNGFAAPAAGSRTASVTVEPGTQLAPSVPVLIEAPNGSTAPTGDPGQGLNLYLPPEYLFDPSKDKLTQRVGASITLASFTTTNSLLGSGGPVVLSQGASITVDQGQSVTLESMGQVTADGAIIAPAGTIALLNLATNQYVDADQSAAISVWVGQHAVLDASGVAQTMLDARQNPFGVVPGGGTITIGGVGNFADIANATAPEAFVFVRPGATVEANGAQAAVDVVQPSASLAVSAANSASDIVQDASAGGTISLVSASGIYANGVMQAKSGGVGAAGGTLRLQLDTEEYSILSAGVTNPSWVLTPHRILVSATLQQSPLSPYLQPQQSSFVTVAGVAGQAAISQQQIDAGGFGNLVFFARDQIAFAGNVDLRANQSITLEDYTTTDTMPGGRVSVAAPTVLLAGAPVLTPLSQLTTYGVSPTLGQSGSASNGFSKTYAPCLSGAAGCTGATLKVTAQLIELENNLRFGAHETVTDSNPPAGQKAFSTTIDVPGFNTVSLDSAGDIIFAAGAQPILTTNPTDSLNGLRLQQDSLESTGNIVLTAQRIYPVTGVSATVAAGLNIFNINEPTTQVQTTNVFDAGVLDINGIGGSAPQSPLSAFGSLSFVAGSIVQAGFVSAPLGAIDFSAVAVTLAPKSVTTVSAAGLIIPFGGTTDGVAYSYDGQDLTFAPASYGAVTPGSTTTPSNQGILFDTARLVVRQNAVLDVSGGGVLSGGGGEVLSASGTSLLSQGFISGSGGSTDILTTSFISFNPASHTATQGIAGNGTGEGVFAILPSSSSAYAPSSLLDASAKYVGSEPALGEQVRIGAGVPGLAAGTYTLFPSYYALLPGAYRVQFNQGISTAANLAPTTPDGLSYDVSGYLGVSGTTLRNSLPTTLTVTSGADVQRYSQYDQQSYADFATSQAAVFDTPRPYLPQDGGVIDFTFFPQAAAATNNAETGVLALQFSGVARLGAASGGYDGAVGISGDTYDTDALEILAPGGKPAAGVISVPVASIDALNAPLLEIGGSFGSPLSTSDYVEYANPQDASVTVDPGAKLTAGAVWLFAHNQITVSPGADIDTLGHMVNLPDSRTGVVFVGGSNDSGQSLGTALASPTIGVANGDYVATSPTGGSGDVSIGTESTKDITYRAATLAAADFVGVFGGGNISIASTTKIAAATFEIAVPEINVGTVSGAPSASGFNLTQVAIDELLAGNDVAGAPVLQTLDLAAASSLNFFGSVAFGGSGLPALANLVLTTPAIYGYGAAANVASLDVANLVWNGAAGVPGPVIPAGAGTGSGSLSINAQQITFGYPTQAQPQDQTSQNRLILGFENVDISASRFISANNMSALSVDLTPIPASPATSNKETIGALTLSTPLLTTAPGASFSVASNGTLSVQALSSAAPAATVPTGLGGAITLTAGQDLTLNSAVSLPSGDLSLNAAGAVTLSGATTINLAGQAGNFYGVTQNSWGGTLSVASSGSNVTLAPSARIDISAAANDAGAIDIVAASGTVALLGSITGTAGRGFQSGGIDIVAQSLGGTTEFAALNTKLTAGGVFGTRHFEETGAADLIGGTLTIGNELVAQNISVAVDQGSIDVIGTLDASGAAPGTISLAVSQNLSFGATSLLDAHGTILQTDSTGAAIASENTAEIALTAAAGTLTLSPGARINVTSPDGFARGDIELNVPRVQSADNTGDTANITASGPLTIAGAGTIAVNAFRIYQPTDKLFAKGMIDQADLATVDLQSSAFIAAVSHSVTGTLLDRLAGLTAYTAAFHLRPGVEIDSDVASNGTLTLSGDIDLSGYRYDSVNPQNQKTSIYGSGEPGVLWLRATGNLNVYGSLTDGFAPPPATPDDNGWVLHAGVNASGQNLVVTKPVALAGGTALPTIYPIGNYSLGYDVIIADGATLNAGAAAPSKAALTTEIVVGNTFQINGTLTTASGTQLFGPGQAIAANTILPAGTIVSAGTVLPFQVSLSGLAKADGLTVPAGTNFSIFGDSQEPLADNVTVAAGQLIPAYASLQFVGGTNSVSTRDSETVNSESIQGQIWGAAALLPAGDLSWSLRLVSGANLAAADSRAVLPSTTLDAAGSAADPGSLVLSDTHYAVSPILGKVSSVVDFSVLRTGTGSLDLISGGSITEASLYGIYTAGTQTAGVATTYEQPLQDGAAVTRANGADYSAAVALYQANYPTGGGNLLVSAQHDIVGDTALPATATAANQLENSAVSFASNSNAQWLWYQGDSTNPGAWWINFGSFVDVSPSPGTQVFLTGFTGFGTLGGGNATVVAGRDLGVLPSDNGLNAPSSGVGSTGAVNVVVAGTGRADPATGRIMQTGGGALRVDVAGAINPGAIQSTSDKNDQLDGVIGDVRGDVTIKAATIGSVVQSYVSLGGLDPRPVDPFTSETFQAYGGPDLVLGDASASILARGDAVVSGVSDPTTAYQYQLGSQAAAVNTIFSLWQPTTLLSVQSLGGAIVPITAGNAGGNDARVTTDGLIPAGASTLYPPILDLTAYTGNVEAETETSSTNKALELSPAADGTLQVLAGGSIYDPNNGLVGFSDLQVSFDISGAASAGLPTALSPSYTQGSVVPGLFAAEPDTATGLLHQGDTRPARFYAVSGDIVGLMSGQICNCTVTTQSGPITTPGYIAATAVQVQAGGDVVNFNGIALNSNAADISTVTAGRDVIYANEQIGGPGLLQIEAGRNVYQGDEGALTSIGEIGQALTVATRNDGAGITVLAGVGASDSALPAFAHLYLDPANLANPDTPLQEQRGKVERSYQAQLITFLQTRFGYTGSAAGALAFFLTLPQEQQTAFLLTVYFAELNQSGLDDNDTASRFYHSYLEGQEAIATLFPDTNPKGTAAPSGGSLTLFSGAAGDSGIHTLFGGGITTVVPYGVTSLGDYGFVPGPGAGLVTEGSGAIDMYSYGSVELGQSRVLTTFGGNILIWMSSDGEINAGRGSKSTVLNAPIAIGYDDYGNTTLSPTVPSTGAGIGTISPIPQVAAGDVNLIAPVGTVDAGEAGIRASGNANVVALTIVNGGNLNVGGKSTGIATLSAPSAAAQAAASSAGGAATNAAQQVNHAPPAQAASVIDVEVLSITGGADDDERKRRKRGGA